MRLGEVKWLVQVDYVCVHMYGWINMQMRESKKEEKESFPSTTHFAKRLPCVILFVLIKTF